MRETNLKYRLFYIREACKVLINGLNQSRVRPAAKIPGIITMNTSYAQDVRSATVAKFDQRREPRERRSGNLQIMTLGFRQRVLSGVLYDVSNSGLCIHLKRRIAKGVIVVTTLDNQVRYGSVQYCTRVPEGMKTGIQIIRGFR